MTPKHLFPAAAALAIAGFAATLAVTGEARSAPPAAAWAGDTVHSYVLFKVKHLGASWNYGRFNDFTVTAETDDAGKALTSITFDVKADSVDTGNAKRDQHLRGADFFNTDEFPSISFRTKKAAAGDAGAVTLEGDLTMHGVTKPVTVKAERSGEGKGQGGEALVGYEAVFTVKRSEFGMTYGVGPLGDEVTVTVAVELAKK